MHELPVTTSILEIVLRHAAKNGVERVSAIDLSIGALSDLEPEWLQAYLDHISRGTPAAGARLRVRRSPLTLRCVACPAEFEATRESLDRIACPDCGSGDASVVAGAGYTVEAMEAE